MFKQPFFKYSFFILLLVDIAYTLGLVYAGIATFSIDNAKASAVWFVTFYWLPVWAAAVAILSLRARNINRTMLEWGVSVSFMTVGNMVTDHALSSMFGDYIAMGGYVILNGLLWGTGIYFISRYIESKQKFSVEQHSRKQAQLETLRYQLNPHFMFNSLNTISAYIHTNPDLADEVLHQLADILRYSLDTAEQERIPLQQELTIIEKYLHIEQARFGEKLEVVYNIPTQLKSISIPPLLLQPIVENAIKHNAKQENLTINITLSEITKGIKILVADNGQGFTQDIIDHKFGKGIGMRNIEQRVNQLEAGKLTLSNEGGACVSVEMSL